MGGVPCARGHELEQVCAEEDWLFGSGAELQVGYGCVDVDDESDQEGMGFQRIKDGWTGLMDTGSLIK